MSKSKDANQEVFQLSYDLTHLTQHSEDPNSSLASRTTRDAMGPIAQGLYDKAKIPAVVADKCDNTNFFVKGVTTIAKAEDHFAFLENTYKVFQINLMGQSKEYKRVEMNLIVRYVNSDLLGENKPDFSDTVYWASAYRTDEGVYPDNHPDLEKRGQPYTERSSVSVLTKIGTGVQHAQQEIYELLRASIRLYMKKATWQLVDMAIKSLEKKNNVKDCDLVSPTNPKRTTWKWIKEWITTNLCTLTLGSYHFRTLYIIHRHNGEPRHRWMHRIQEAHIAVKGYANGWEGIGCKDFLRKCWIWFGDNEKKVVREAYRTRGTKSKRYKTDTAIIRKETLEKFISFVAKINPTDFSDIPFKISWCKDGLSELLYTRQFVVKLLKEKEDANNQIKFLKNKVKALENGSNTGGQANKRGKKNKKKADTVEKKEEGPPKDPRRIPLKERTAANAPFCPEVPKSDSDAGTGYATRLNVSKALKRCAYA